jgi:hypothetical protein
MPPNAIVSRRTGCTANAATAPTAPSATDFTGNFPRAPIEPPMVRSSGDPVRATGARRAARAFRAGGARSDAMDLERAPPTLRAGAMPWEIGGTREAAGQSVVIFASEVGYRNPKTLK